MTTKRKRIPREISVRAETYDRLRAALGPWSVGRLVDRLIVDWLDGQEKQNGN